MAATLSRGWNGRGDGMEILGSIYTDVSESFQKGLYPVARCVKAGKHDLAVVGMEVEQVGNLVGTGNWENPQRGRVYSGNGLSPAMNGIGGGGSLEPKIVVHMHGGHAPAQYSIRKLTPLECWRLMGFSDGDFHKAETANSNSQLYKQAGNSIVKDVLMAIFRQMLPEEGKQDKEEVQGEQGTGTGSHAWQGKEERPE